MACRLNMSIRKMSLWLQRYNKKTSAANVFKNLQRVTAKYVKSEASTANRAVLTSLKFMGLVTPFALSATEEDNHLCREDTQEHAKRVHGRVANRRCFVRANRVSVRQCGWVGASTCQHSHNGEVVELVF